MIRTKLKNGNEAVSFWYGDSLVTEFYDKPGPGQSQIDYRETEAGDLDDAGLSHSEILASWHQAQIDMWEEEVNAD